MVRLKSRVASLWRNVLHSNRVEQDLDDEVRAAFELIVDEKIRSGIGVEAARRAAALELGGVESVKEHVRDVRAGASLDSLLQDLRYAARVLRRSPLFTLTAVLSLGIGLAGNSLVFGLVDTYLLRNRPGIANPQRLAEVGRIDTGERGGFYSGDGFDTFSYPNYLDYRARQTVFEGLAAYHTGPIATFGLGTTDRAVRVSGAFVSANYFAVLGVRMALGRGFLPEKERLASPTVVTVISYRLAFSYDGKWLMFTSEQGGINDEEPLVQAILFGPQSYGDMYAYRLQDGTTVRLTHNKWEEGVPSWEAPVSR